MYHLSHLHSFFHKVHATLFLFLFVPSLFILSLCSYPHQSLHPLIEHPILLHPIDRSLLSPSPPLSSLLLVEITLIKIHLSKEQTHKKE
ncbi:hypothetical protein BKA57DRAFT_216144 [Linnemannia elongata]|nr:hypothetical protein BKA57DRAFT_216144 [Linnemannia elongata]